MGRIGGSQLVSFDMTPLACSLHPLACAALYRQSPTQCSPHCPTSSTSNQLNTSRQLVIDTCLGICICRDLIKPYGPIDNLEELMPRSNPPPKPVAVHVGTSTRPLGLLRSLNELIFPFFSAMLTFSGCLRDRKAQG